jgi:phosphoethanolamine N-methyltransferase
VETGVLERARRAAEAAGLAGRADFRLVAPGPLPVEPASFDVVFSKDVLMTIEDKGPVYADVLRVLRPGGWFVASDWLRRDGPVSPGMRRWLLFASGLIGMKSAAETARMLEAAGFVKVEIVNRNGWYREEARRDLARMEGRLWPQLVEARSEQAAGEALEFWRLMIEVLDSGDLCPAHVRAQKPA